MNAFTTAQLRYDMATPPDESWKDAAIDELWDDCATAYATENVGYILDREDTAELIQRAAGFAWAKASDDTKRGFADELLEIIRAYCVQKEADINAECIRRAEAMRREARGAW